MSKFDAFRQRTNVAIYWTNTASGRLFDLILLGVILISVVIVMQEIVKGFDTKYHRELIILEWFIIIFFTFEHLFRIISLRKRLKYSFSIYGIIHLISTLPMYFSLLFAGTSILPVVRALRLLRLFKILNHTQFPTIHTFKRNADCQSRKNTDLYLFYAHQHYTNWFPNVCCRRRRRRIH